MLNNYIEELKDKNIYISKESIVSSKAHILFNTIILGNSIIEDDVVIGPNTTIINSKIETGANIIYSYIINSVVGKKTKVGPFSHLRDNAYIKDDCRIGNFVEIKNSVIDNNSKASHLAYIGDSEVGYNCNFGCGSITVNYDGVNKYKTIIEDNVFIGCNTNLVAPITVHSNSFIACGSTITNDVPENTLAIARSRQLNKINYYK